MLCWICKNLTSKTSLPLPVRKDKVDFYFFCLLTSQLSVFYPDILCSVLDAISRDPRISCVVSFGTAAAVSSTVPIAFHVPTSYEAPETNASTSVHKYKTPSPYFVLPQAEDYKPTFASIAHTRNVVFLRKHIGGPHFDIEAIWDEHTYFEFEVRSVSQTMGTMVVCRLLSGFYRVI